MGLGFGAGMSGDWGRTVLRKGVRYSLVLPAGSAHARFRDDIVNEEVVLNFIGGYEETVPPLNYVWCSLFTDHSDVLDIVTFIYDRPVLVAEGAKLQLWGDRQQHTGQGGRRIS